MNELPTSKQNLWRMICLSVTHEEVGAYLEDGTDYEGPTEPIDARCHAWHPDLVDYQRVTEPLLTREEAAADPEVRMLILDIYTRDAKAARVMDVEADGRDLLCPFCGGSGPRNDDRWHRSDCDRR